MEIAEHFSKTYNVLNRDIDLVIHFDGECITSYQKESFEDFERDYDNIITTALVEIVKYIRCTYSSNMTDKDYEKLNVFSILKPKYVYIYKEDGVKKIGISCIYKYDLDNSPIAVFIDNKFDKVFLDNE